VSRRVDSPPSMLHPRAAIAFALVAAAVLLVGGSARAETAPDRSPSKRFKPHLAAVAGVGFPRPFGVEALVGVDRLVAVGLEYSFLPATSLFGIDTSLSAFAGDARFFPFRNSFFVGLRGGRQHMHGAATVTVPPYGTFSESVDVDTWFINPRAGFFWMWNSGLAIGTDLGVQIPLSASTSSTLPDSALGDPRVTSVTSTFTTNVIPTFDLFRIGMAL
jgi:hypothetical protein